MEKKLSIIISLALFVIFVSMIIFGQKQVGYVNLAVMLVGLLGLLGLLYAYNSKYH